MGSPLLPSPKRQARHRFPNESRDPCPPPEVSQVSCANAESLGSGTGHRGCFSSPRPGLCRKALGYTWLAGSWDLPSGAAGLWVLSVHWGGALQGDKRGRRAFTGARKQSPAWVGGGSGLQLGKGAAGASARG